ncbi:zinc ribbon domain-containing protein [Gallaecimonas sp. GXIMD4217]|uniref:zinc ribbon domain-containing protein n=1 Tax=Gallaecimonas sp. GXIMD4217 TaxID=3131927 RepID=UPI00311B11A8
MAIIRCYNCGKRISDKAELCPHCGTTHSKDPEVQARAAKLKALEEQQKLNNYSMVALLLFLVGGFLFSVWSDHPRLDWVARGLMALGFVAYIGVRARMLWLKNMRKH